MPRDGAHEGSDLRLFGDLHHAACRAAGSDLSVVNDPRHGRAGDLQVVAGIDALKQALLMRLLTPAGELAALGHPNYGSRLCTLAGAPLTPSTLRRARLYVLEALAGESRVQAVRSLSVQAVPGHEDRIDIHLSLQIGDGQKPVNLAFQLSLAEEG